MIFSNHIKNTDGSNNGDWNMVEFPDVGANHGFGGRTIKLCRKDGELNDCNGDWFSSGGYPCATMTEGGDFLLHMNGVFKLGSCGLEKINSYPGFPAQQSSNDPTWSGPGLFCGKFPGGAIFCYGKECMRYHDVDQSWSTMPEMNEDGFQVSLFSIESRIQCKRGFKLKTESSLIVMEM